MHVSGRPFGNSMTFFTVCLVAYRMLRWLFVLPLAGIDSTGHWYYEVARRGLPCSRSLHRTLIRTLRTTSRGWYVVHHQRGRRWKPNPSVCVEFYRQSYEEHTRLRHACLQTCTQNKTFRELKLYVGFGFRQGIYCIDEKCLVKLHWVFFSRGKKHQWYFGLIPARQMRKGFKGFN
jgi:hypothetical protein